MDGDDAHNLFHLGTLNAATVSASTASSQLGCGTGLKLSLLGLTDPDLCDATEARRHRTSCGAMTRDSTDAALFSDIFFSPSFVRWRVSVGVVVG